MPLPPPTVEATAAQSAAQAGVLGDLSAAGVAIWLDGLSRDLLAGGGLQQLVDDWHVVGVTSSPTTFAHAVSAVGAGDRYADQLTALGDTGTNVDWAVLTAMTDDVRAACDVLAPVYQATGHRDGSVAIQVDPRLARDTDATIAAVRQLWSMVDRPNLYITIPGTVQGLPAITQAISEGISVNVTLIFSVSRCRDVLDAYAAGLESALDHGMLADIPDIRSVASVFIAPLDAVVDAQLTADGRPDALQLRSQAGIANARLAYQAHQQFTASARWRGLVLAGATAQRPLWASTGVPNTRYVTALVTAGTVAAMPAATLSAVAADGVITGDTITSRYPAASATLRALAAVGVDLKQVTDRLEHQGLTTVEDSWPLTSVVHHHLHP